ncbi:MAG TPA: outer membrane protein assembly factor BamD [Thermodesulfobacterium commune]|uniref:Outer membrane protein assembly factor BamD n=1 Tax=Thermodesulfobacterium commune TaxID=1741 RepID=A0A3B8N4H6_9BACT|nr:outer membrane protein assembly factor BamD [Thermodesulfobacterium commune]
MDKKNNLTIILCWFLVFGLLFGLYGCGTISKIGSQLTSRLEKEVSKKADKEEEEDLATLLREAERLFNRGSYDLAYEYYKKISDMYPGSPQAILAELRMADSKFWAGEYLEALSLYESFEKFYPNNEAIPYVIFQIGTCYYKLKLSYDRDQSYAKKAIETYERLLQNYPKSPYRAEAAKRIKELREQLATHEFYVAQFYYKLGYYRAAYNRVLYILNNFSGTNIYQQAQKVASLYYQKALLETKELAEGTKKDFWGDRFP